MAFAGRKHTHVQEMLLALGHRKLVCPHRDDHIPRAAAGRLPALACLVVAAGCGGDEKEEVTREARGSSACAREGKAAARPSSATLPGRRGGVPHRERQDPLRRAGGPRRRRRRPLRAGRRRRHHRPRHLGHRREALAAPEPATRPRGSPQRRRARPESARTARSRSRRSRFALARKAHMRELTFQRAGRLAWGERPAPELVEPTDALVRPFIAGRCDGDTRAIAPSRVAGDATRHRGARDRSGGGVHLRPGPLPWAVRHRPRMRGAGRGGRRGRSGLAVGQTVVVPWAVSCGRCDRCRPA